MISNAEVRTHGNMPDATPGLGPPQESSPQPNSWFEAFPASQGPDAPIEQHLERPRRMSFGSGKSNVIATSVFSAEWIATSTSDTVRLYQRDSLRLTTKLKSRVPSIPLRQGQGKNIRAIDLSADLLAIITESHLIVYAYKEVDFLRRPLEKQIDQGGRWRPKAIKILQNDPDATQTEVSAWIAVGGRGVNAVNLFRYSRDAPASRWMADNVRIILQCPGNSGSMNLVTFSPPRYNEGNRFLVLGITETSWIHCWKLPPLGEDASVLPFWRFDVGGGTVAPVSDPCSTNHSKQD